MRITAEGARLAKIEKAKRARALLYQREPDRWYVERFGGRLTDLRWSEWPEYSNHKWDGTPDPFMLAFQSLAAWKSVGIESATGTGKTFMAARVAYWFLDVFENSLVVTTAPKERQLKSILWGEMSACFGRFKKIRPRAEMFDLRVLPDGSKVAFGQKLAAPDDDDEFSNLHQAIGVVAGVKAGEESATRMQGFHRKYMLFIVEEAAGVPLPVMTAIKNTVSGDYNPVLAIGNPDSVTDALHQFCEQGHVQHITISAYDHPNIVRGVTVIDGATSKKSIEIRRAEYGEESNLYKSRVRGIAPEQSVDSLIMMKWILSCWKLHPTYKAPQPDHYSYNAVGVDVANSENGDAAALVWGQGYTCKRVHEFRCENATHLADNLVRSDDELRAEGKFIYNVDKLTTYQVNAQNVGVDAVGVGVATFNRFKDLHYNVVALQGGCNVMAVPLDAEGKPLYKFRSLRAQMWFQARIDLQNNNIDFDVAISPRDLYQLAKELTMVKYRVNDGYMIIEPKEDLKKRLNNKSPNKADAFVYWNWIRKDRTNQGHLAGLPIGYGNAGIIFTDETTIDDESGIWKPGTDETY